LLTKIYRVIIPTVESLLKAIKYYETQGGTASIYVNEDGLQAIDPEMAAYDLPSTSSQALIFVD